MEITGPLLGLIIGFILVYFTVPPIVQFHNLKGIGTFGNAKIKTAEPPKLGGIPVFFGSVISTILATYQYDFLQLKMWIAGTIILLFSGLKSDMLYLHWNKKLLVKIAVAILLTIYGNYHLNFLNNAWDNLNISAILNYILNIICFLIGLQFFSLLGKKELVFTIMSIAILILFCFGFYHLQACKYVVLCLSSIGSLLGFLYFYFLGNKNKISLGETGSLIIGLTITILCIKFSELYFNLQ